MLRSLAVAAPLLACAAPPPHGPPPPGHAHAPARFLKGQLHLHSNNSGDSDTPPAEVARWYAERGYDFIVFTDHNRVTTDVAVPGLLVGAGAELTMNLRDCEPPPATGLCPLHVNALLVDPARDAGLAPPGDRQRVTLYRHGIATARAMGGLAQVNHPNFHYGAGLDTLAALVDGGPLLLEIANEAVDSNNAGDAAHPSTEALWDGLLRRGLRVWGTATDDAHHYADAAAVQARGELAFVGDRGFVMVRAAPELAAIRDALARGDFYASNGALLDDVRCDGGVLRVWPSDRAARVTCVTARGEGPAQAQDGGHACTAEDYARAVIDDGAGRRAWSQPCWR